MKTARKFEAKQVRYHEPGHTVVARLLGTRVIAVTARPHEYKYRGMTFTDRRGVERDLAFYENEIKIYIAGTLAQAKLWPDTDWDFNDICNAYHCAHEIAVLRGLRRPKRLNIIRQYPATEKIIAAQVEQTETLIDANWDAIVRVAKALHFNPRLEQGAIDRLITGERRRNWKNFGPLGFAILHHVN